MESLPSLASRPGALPFTDIEARRLLKHPETQRRVPSFSGVFTARAHVCAVTSLLRSCTDTTGRSLCLSCWIVRHTDSKY